MEINITKVFLIIYKVVWKKNTMPAKKTPWPHIKFTGDLIHRILT